MLTVDNLFRFKHCKQNAVFSCDFETMTMELTF